ncbi:MAG: MATE family efflux transporter [Bacteroidales bacterium]|nr:MATE family efflux transporter [Bacteroidales bacterium]
MKDLTTGKETTLIVKFAIPMLLGNLFHQFYHLADSIIVGQLIGKAALAAVGVTMPIIFTLISLVVGLSIGFNVIIAQYFGAKDFVKVQHTVDTMNIILLVSSVLFSLIGLIFLNPILTLIKTPADIHVQASQYLRIYFIGMLFFFGFNGTSAILRGMGDSKTPLYFIIISSVLNVFLDILFIAVFHWGIEGAAWATIFSQGVSFILSVIYINRYHSFLKIKLHNIFFDRFIFKKSVQIGLPTALQQSFVALGMVALLSVVNLFGTNVVAAYSIATRIESFISLPAMNFAAALSTFVGQNIGAQRLDRVLNGYISTQKIMFLITICISSLIFIFSATLSSMFTSDTTVIQISKEYLQIVAFFFVCFSAMFINNGILRGAGDTLIPMFITLFSLWIVRIPLAFILSKSFGYYGIWWSIPIAWFFGMTLSYIYYKTGNWKKKNVINNIPPDNVIGGE